MLSGKTRHPVNEGSFSLRAGSGKGMMIAGLLSAPLWILLSVLVTEAYADTGIADRIEVSGRISTEIRLYPESAANSGQRSHASGLAAEATAYVVSAEKPPFWSLSRLLPSSLPPT